MGFQLGLDTGGTYTDAVLVDEHRNVVRCAKSLTTHGDLITGLRSAADQVLADVPAGDVQLVCLSTTLATNALVEGRGRPVALVLIGFNDALLQRAGLSQALGDDPHLFVEGGHMASGQPVCPLDDEVIRQFVARVDARVEAYAVSAVFAVRNPAHENEAQALIASLSGKPVSCGHHLSAGLDAPRRALTALLNARLIPVAAALLEAARALLEEKQVEAPLMVVKGDGSLISDELAVSHPVETILSGPAASVVGARFLCGEQELIVSDMGGTTTDIALIRNGQPRLNPDGATVAGWRTMVEAIEVRTYGLGGDSAVLFDRERRVFLLSTARVLPLSLLAEQYSEVLDVLEAQLELPVSTTHSAQFVMAHGADVSLSTLSPQQRELYERIRTQPIAVQTLFSDQSLVRALDRLEQRGIVLRSGFTPSDASHVLGRQSAWQSRAALLGARLLCRYSADNLGPVFADEEEFAIHVAERVSGDSALLLIDAAAASEGRILNDAQKSLIRAGLQSESDSLYSLQAHLHIPLLGLGAPAHCYYPATASMLGCPLIHVSHADVANALGAVVGTVRQQQLILIEPAGGDRVSVMLPGGPVTYDGLEEAAAAATRVGRELARKKALEAGGEQVSVSVDRQDNVVEQGGQRVFFESRILATAVGRPSLVRPA